MKKRVLVPIVVLLLILQSCVTNYVVAEPSLYTTSYKTDAKPSVYGKKLEEPKSDLYHSIEDESTVRTRILEELEKRAKISAAIKRNNVIDSLLDEAKTYLGTPYRYGGMTRRGIDCSAFVLSAYKGSLGIELPRVAAAQSQRGKRISRTELKKGDLLFFANRRRISHVGMVERVENGEIFFIHASSSKGVTITSLNKSSYWSRRFRFAKRIVTQDKMNQLLAMN